MIPIETVVIDTHALVWYFEDSPRLSSRANEILDRVDQGSGICIVPTIALAELMHISERGRASVNFSDAVTRLLGSQNFRTASLDMDILLHMMNLTRLELHDRIIVATALSVGARLITRDETIRNSNLVECIW